MQHEVLAVNPRKKRGGKKKRSGKGKKRGKKRSAGKKRGKKRSAGKKKAPRRAKKAGKKASPRKKKSGGKKRRGKKRGGKKKRAGGPPRKNPGGKWRFKSGKWVYMIGERVVGGPYTSARMDQIRAKAKKQGVLPEDIIEAKSKSKPAAKAKAKAKAKKGGGGFLMAAPQPEIALVKKELAQEGTALSTAVRKLRQGRSIDLARIRSLESELRAAKARAARARGRGDLSKKEEERLKDKLDATTTALRACQAASKKPGKRRGKKKSTAVARRGGSSAARRRKKWPKNVPMPTMSVDEAIDRLSSAGRNLAKRGSKSSASRLQLASHGHLKLNPLEPVKGHPGLVAQFTSKSSRRAKSVAVTAKTALRKPKPKYKHLSPREKASLMRRLIGI